MMTSRKAAPKILFIDNNSECWLLMERAIRRCLSKTIPIWVSSPQQAIRQLSDWETQEWELPSLIFLDLYLPQVEDGWALLELIKAMSDTIQQIPLIILTSSEAETDIIKAYQLGASSYIIKPDEFTGWLECFEEIRTYWLETVRLPPLRFQLKT